MSKIISVFLTLLSSILIGYISLKINQLENLDKFGNYKIYLIISILFLFISIFSFLIPSKIKINLFLISLSVFITFYIIEFILIQLDFNNEWNQAKVTNHKIQKYYETTGKKYEERSLFDYYNEQRKNNENIVVWRSRENIIINDNELFFSLSGLPNKETIYCNENGFYSKYLSDRYGFNNPDSSWDAENIEYLLLGDSYAHGACVNRPNDIASQLRILSNNDNIITLGQGGSGPLTMYAILKEYYPYKKNVNKILWIYFEGNDLTDMIFEQNNSILNNYLSNENYLQYLKKNERKINLEKSKKIITKQNRVINYIKLITLRNFIINNFFQTKINQENLNDFEIILSKAKDFAISNNSELLFVYLPSYYRFKIKNFKDNKDYKNYDEVLTIVKKLNIPLIDINDLVFTNLKEPLSMYPFGDHGHFNENAFEIISNNIYNKIKN